MTTCDTGNSAVVSQAENRADFLSRSHFRISQDDAATAPSLESVFKRDYIPWKISGKPSAIDPPSPVALHHQDPRFFNEKKSETVKSYPEKYQPKRDFGDPNKLRATNFKMDRDLKNFNQYNTCHGVDFPAYKLDSNLRYNSKEDPMQSFIPNGDREKAAAPVSDYKDKFLGHDARFTKPKKAANKHQEGGPTLLGDERLHHFYTSSSEQFRGKSIPRVRPFPKPIGTNIPEGDKEKEMTYESTQTKSFLPHQTSKSGYDRSSIAGKLRTTNFSLVDGLGTFNTYTSTAADSYKPLFKSAEKIRVTKERNHSDLPTGDDTSRFSMTTNKFHFDNPITLPANIVYGANLRTKSQVLFGDPPQSDKFYSTTTASTYKPNENTGHKRMRSNLTKSDIPVKYYAEETTLPMMKTDYKNPCQSKLVPNEAAISRIRDSHIRAPIGGRYFTTEHQDQFVPKETSRVPIDGGKLQRSTVPLGTLQISS